MNRTWQGLTAAYTDQERDEMRGLLSAEALVLHALKSEFDGILYTPGLGPKVVRSGGEQAPSKPSIDGAPSSDRTASPATLTIVCTQRTPENVIEAIEDFIEAQRLLPYGVSWVFGDTALGERRAIQYCQDREIPVTIVAKAVKGEWDEGSDIRDERVVAQADAVYAVDMSARSRHYEQLCKRMRKPFHTL